MVINMSKIWSVALFSGENIETELLAWESSWNIDYIMMLQWKSSRFFLSLKQHILRHSLFESLHPQLYNGDFYMGCVSLFLSMEPKYLASSYISPIFSWKHVMSATQHVIWCWRTKVNVHKKIWKVIIRGSGHRIAWACPWGCTALSHQWSDAHTWGCTATSWQCNVKVIVSLPSITTCIELKSSPMNEQDQLESM